jgi:hypothetical protein
VLTGIDDAFISRLVTGTVQHRVRRVHEMEAVVSMLEELGEPPLTADATRQVIESVELRGVPSLELRRFRWQRLAVDRTGAPAGSATRMRADIPVMAPASRVRTRTGSARFRSV